MRELFQKDFVFVGHNIVRFDIVHLEKILGIKIKAKVIDTLGLSWCLFPTRKRHGLEDWGEEFGVPKPKIDDWYSLPVEEYVHRCEEDVRINYRQFQNCLTILNHLYERDQGNIFRYMEYITFKMFQAKLQEQVGWHFDKEYAEKHLIEMTALKEEKVSQLREAMPKVPIIKVKTRPKIYFKKDGSLSVSAVEWEKFCKEQNKHPTVEEIEYVSGYEEPNPNSTDQLKAWLYKLGWKPSTFKDVKDKKKGTTRQVPQIQKEKQKGGGVCDSIKKLYEKEPRLELLDGLSILSHRISILEGFFRDVRSNGKLKAKISGFTNTLRVKHTEIVNLPKINIPYGEVLRGSLIAKDGYLLCGADMASLEDRLKQHYIYPLDPEYVHEMSKPGYDPHLDIAKLAGRVSEHDVEFYKELKDKDDLEEEIKLSLKRIKMIRDIMKNVNYAGQYGAGPPRISITGGIELSEARELHRTYWKRNWAIKEVANEQVVKVVNGLMWLFNPVSGFWYYLKYEKDKFSTLVQGTASYCFDTWLKYVLEQREQLTATFHDEGVWTVHEGTEERISEILKTAIKKANEELKLNRVLDIDIQFGKRYSSIH